MPFVLFLLGAAAVGLVAASASAKGKGSGGGGGGRTYTLDRNLPAALRQQVLAALATEKNPAKGLSPFQTWDHIADAIKKGDLKTLAAIAKQQLSMAQGVISLIPCVGTGISAAISAGLAVLEGGGPLEVAIRTAYGALPIPPGIREVTDTVLDTILNLAFHHESLSDVVVNVARDEVPSGFPRDVFDTLINIVVKHKPITKVAGGLVDHFVQQYAPHGLGLTLPTALTASISHLPNMLAALPPGVPHGMEHVFGPLHGPDPRAPHVAPPLRLPASPRMVQPLRTALA